MHYNLNVQVQTDKVQLNAQLKVYFACFLTSSLEKKSQKSQNWPVHKKRCFACLNLHFTTDYTCMIVYVTSNKEPWVYIKFSFLEVTV